jgi:hypothetical protein
LIVENVVKLLTQEILAKLPPLYSQEKKGLDAEVVVKFFTPDANAVWYATEFDGEDLFFGYADLGLGCGELGYFSLSELQSVKGAFGLHVERDLYWTPKPLKEIVGGN